MRPGTSTRSWTPPTPPCATRSGTLAKAARRLAAEGINIEAIMPIGMEGDEVHVAFVTSDAAKARQVLSSAGMASR